MIDREDWVHIDEHNKRVEYLEERKRELEQVVEDMDYDARYILALVMGIKQRAVDQKYWDIVGQCDYIIDLHTAMDHVEALKILKSDAEA